MKLYPLTHIVLSSVLLLSACSWHMQPEPAAMKTINSDAGIAHFVDGRIQDRSEQWTFYIALQFPSEPQSADFFASASKRGLDLSSVTRWGNADWRLQVTMSMTPTAENVQAAEAVLNELLQQHGGAYLLVMGGKKKT